MAPTRKSRSVNKRFAHSSEDSPAKYGDASNKSRQRKKKLSDMLGPKWNKEELQRFYDAYRKYGKDWKKVATAVRNRTAEMAESLYTMNRAYLSLPEGTASVVGLIAMMTDHYSNLEGSDSEQESNDGVGAIQKPQNCTHGKLLSDAAKGSDGPADVSQSLASRYGCLSLLKKKRSGGSQPRAVGKRTPRVPVKYTYDITEKYISPSRYGKKVKVDADDDDVVHEVALVLAEASHRGGSPQVSYTPSKKKECSESEMTSGKDFGNRMGDDGGEGSLGSTEADNRDYPGRSYFSNRKGVSAAVVQQKGKKWSGRKHEGIDMKSYHADDVKEACSGTEEGQRVSGAKRKLGHDVADAAGGRSFGPKKKSKKVLFGNDEGSAFDALQTLADLSLMMPTNTETENVSFEEKVTTSRKEALLARPQTEKVKAVSEKKGDKLSEFRSSKLGRTSPTEANIAPEASTRKRKQKSPAPKMPSDAQIKSSVIQNQKNELSDNVKKSGSRNRHSSIPSQPQVGQLGRISEHSSSSADLRRDGDDSVVPSVQATAPDDVILSAKSKSRRKANSAQIQRNSRGLKFSEAYIKDQSKISTHLLHHKQLSLKESLSNCLSNGLARRWCAFEWFYSAIDFPWFAKSEFVEYLYHVGLGHVPRLTRVEWGVIRSSLGKPRRFSAQFLKEEKEKLYSYRYSVRTHYSELRNGTREGLPTDLARPLTVGQRVVAIHPRTREIHNGSVLTVDHDRCRIQFDRPELGVEFVMDIDCMPLNPSENMPVYLSRNNFAVDLFLEPLKHHTNEQTEDRKKEYITFAPIRKMENVDGHSYDPASIPNNNLLLQGKEAVTSPTSQIKFGYGEVVSPQHAVVSHPSIMCQMQAKEADIRALAELSRALDRKNALVTELKRMNDDVSEEYSLRDVDSFKKQYAAVLVQLDEVFDQVSCALHSLRQRNTYQGNIPQLPNKAIAGFDDRGHVTFGWSRLDAHESASHVSEIVETSRIKARKMVDAAMQAMSSFKDALNSAEKIEEAIDFVSQQLFVDESSIATLASRANGTSVPSNQSMSTLSTLSATDHTPDSKSNGESDLSEPQAPVELITNSVATLLMIQKCTERQFPPADVAQVLDLAVMGLHPCSSQNLPIYAEIQKCMGIIRNQILALVPT